MTQPTPILRKPPWLKVRLPDAGKSTDMMRLISTSRLYTVCQEARCPNLAECFQAGTATFLILGDCCTRNCRYCNVQTGIPQPLDKEEPERLAAAVGRLGLSYVVITSVTRNDLEDGGAGQFVRCIAKLREAYPDCAVEVLIPDFQGSFPDLRSVLDAAPTVINHNIEVCRPLFPALRPEGDYDRSLALLRRVREYAPDIPTKSGFMIGLGEEKDDIINLLEDLRAVDCQRLTIGQYLQPTRNHWPVHRYYHPEEFSDLRQEALNLGFKSVMAGPLVRSSYHAEEML